MQKKNLESFIQKETASVITWKTENVLINLKHEAKKYIDRMLIV